MVGVAKVDLATEELLSFFVMLEQEVIVSRNTLELRKVLLNTEKGFVHILNADRQDLLNEQDACLAINHRQKYSSPILTTDHKVYLHIAHTPSFTDLRLQIADFGSRNFWIRSVRLCTLPAKAPRPPIFEELR